MKNVMAFCNSLVINLLKFMRDQNLISWHPLLIESYNFIKKKKKKTHTHTQMYHLPNLSSS